MNMKLVVRPAFGGPVIFSVIAMLTGAAGAQDGGNGFYWPRIWSGFNGGEMNISSFIFRDMNADGIYDMGDRPFANVAVQVTRAMRNVQTVRSNISGFANFRASAILRDREIVQPGPHHFIVRPPPGWRITTGNQEQEVVMTLLLGSPGDMVAMPPTTPVGLTQLPEIRGHVQAGEQDAPTKVSASGPDGKTQTVPVDEYGAYQIQATTGAWIVTASAGDGKPVGRRVDVGQFPVVLPMTSDAGAPQPTTGEVANFDDLITSESVAKIPSGYHQLNWHNWVVTHNRTYNGEGYINGTMSGEYVVYNGSGHPVSLDRDRPFDFVGGYFTGAWSDAEGEILNIKAWSGDVLKHDDRIRLSAMSPVYFAADYRGVSRIEFFTDHYWQVVADDLAFSFP